MSPKQTCTSRNLAQGDEGRHTNITGQGLNCEQREEGQPRYPCVRSGRSANFAPAGHTLRRTWSTSSATRAPQRLGNEKPAGKCKPSSPPRIVDLQRLSSTASVFSAARLTVLPHPFHASPRSWPQGRPHKPHGSRHRAARSSQRQSFWALPGRLMPCGRCRGSTKQDICTGPKRSLNLSNHRGRHLNHAPTDDQS
ncbi:hypothetical protein NDU88_004947 [Pleurodeles waltl]|uniref:Uncharacterized protein n=1 Tax=Pleurodeles waltl TaxID=8319 RepID=A0AAV7KZ81_PLEWA|nr:hypothetical protein NDU88_004947 [Pleurodeles waltl]